MGKWIKKHKVLFIVLCVILSIVAAIVIFIAVAVNSSKKMLANMMSQETVVVERRDLVESISATGSITSSNQKTVIAAVSGVKITEVNIAVGDQVSAGDLICVLDSTSLEENLEYAQKNLENAAASANMSVEAARRQYNEAVASMNSSKEQSEKQVAAAKDAMDSAESTMQTATAEYNKAVESLNAAQSLVDMYAATSAYRTYLASLKPYKDAVDAAEKAFLEAQNALEGDKENATLISNYTSKADALETARNDLAEFELRQLINNVEVKGYADAVAEKEAAEAIKQAAEAQMNAAVSAYNTAKTAYDSAVAAANNANSSASNLVVSAYDGLTSASNSAEVATFTLCQQVEALEEQIAACKIYAPINGVVTALNVAVGDTYVGSAVAIIEDNYTYEIATQISEYDIGKVKVGQQVVIKTNGTGDTELLGTVKTIAPRATLGASVSYQVVVSVDTVCEGLKLDMTAKMSIIINSTLDTLTVPFESVLTDDEGRNYIQVTDGVRTDAGTYNTRNVYVRTGLESDYYIEIFSDEIDEGTIVIVPRSEYTALDLYALLYEEGGLEY